MVGDIFEDHCCLLGKEVLDNVFFRDFLNMKEIPFTYKSKRYKRQYEWIFRGDVAKIIIGVKREYGIVGAMVYINYSKLRYEPYVAIVDCSDVFESIDVVADMVEGALNWVYKDSGITLCLEPWIPAEGEVIQWGRDCNEAHTLAAINGSLRIDENWDLDTCVKRIINKHTKKKGVSPPEKKNTKKSGRTLRAAIIDQTKADVILQKIVNCVIGKTEPMDLMMPVTAAYAAKVMRRPTWSELRNSHPEFILSETSFYRLIDPDCLTYYHNDVFNELVEYFKSL
jgi:hypothetical protein